MENGVLNWTTLDNYFYEQVTISILKHFIVIRIYQSPRIVGLINFIKNNLIIYYVKNI